MHTQISGPRKPFWAAKLTRSQALPWILASAGLALALAWGATRLSPFSMRSHLALGTSELDELYLTALPADPARALLTTRRENSTWTRDRASQAGDPYWVRRYGDPARPDLTQRILLTSRSRGAHLLVPLGALDLERALSEPLEPGQAQADASRPRLGRELARVYLNRSFAGVFLHLRFPKRATAPGEARALDHDLVVVRGNELVTTDFLLQPNAELYRAALADGLMPLGPFTVNPATGGELVLYVSAAPDGATVPLFAPISLLDELHLCWGRELGTIVDDRWRLDSARAFALRPPTPEERVCVARNGALHLAARLGSAKERRALEQALASFTSLEP